MLSFSPILSLHVSRAPRAAMCRPARYKEGLLCACNDIQREKESRGNLCETSSPPPQLAPARVPREHNQQGRAILRYLGFLLSSALLFSPISLETSVCMCLLAYWLLCTHCSHPQLMCVPGFLSDMLVSYM